MTESYKIYAGPGSPYSHKMRAVFRYRRIPHTWLVPQGGFTGSGALGSDSDSPAVQDLRRANKGIIPLVRYPNGDFKADTTPIAHDLEEHHTGRSLIPDRPAIAFLADLLEDMADEFLPIPMFFYRWTDDKDWCARRQMIGWLGPLDDESLAEAAQNFLDRQVNQLTRGGQGLPPREPMAAAYNAFLTVMEALLQRRQFLFGERPSLAEMAIYGQLTQYIADPTVSTLMKEKAVRVFQWTHLIDDLSGYEIGGWDDPVSALNEELKALLRFTAMFYFPMNEQAAKRAGDADLASAGNGAAYRVKCLLALKQALADLSTADRDLIRPILEETGCWLPLQFKAGEQERVVPVRPL